MEFKTVDATAIIDTFLLLLIGIGPKIALVPYLEATAHLPSATKARIVRTMLTTATVIAVLLLVFGGLLTRLLHFSPGALGVASGIILLIIAITMVLGPRGAEPTDTAFKGKDPLQLAVYPLAVPYLLNPAGIVVLVTAWAEAASLAVIAMMVCVLALVLLIDLVVFRWANRVSEHLDASRMLVTEKVFGFLLAALAVQLVLNGLADVGVLHLIGH
jgi:multiple antibiotic resistance protein